MTLPPPWARAGGGGEFVTPPHARLSHHPGLRSRNHLDLAGTQYISRTAPVHNSVRSRTLMAATGFTRHTWDATLGTRMRIMCSRSSSVCSTSRSGRHSRSPLRNCMLSKLSVACDFYLFPPLPFPRSLLSSFPSAFHSSRLPAHPTFIVYTLLQKHDAFQNGPFHLEQNEDLIELKDWPQVGVTKGHHMCNIAHSHA